MYCVILFLLYYCYFMVVCVYRDIKLLVNNVCLFMCLIFWYLFKFKNCNDKKNNLVVKMKIYVVVYINIWFNFFMFIDKFEDNVNFL